MIGIDTNVLVRYLTEDDPAQSRRAAAFIEEARRAQEQLLIQPVVLCELVWVLETAYDLPRETVAGILDRILRTAQFEVAHKTVMWRAWENYRSGPGDFADYLIGYANEDAGAAQTVTFDRGLRKSRHFRVLS
jgi:predicted nucleic-acid-binding protein